MRTMVFVCALGFAAAGAPAARADVIFTYVGAKLDRSGCSGPCTFTHVHFSVRVPGHVRPNQAVSFCGGASCATGTADPVTYSDGQFRLTLKEYTWFECGGSVTLDASGTGVATANLGTAFFHETHPRLVAYGSDGTTGGDFIGGQTRKLGFNVSSSKGGHWTVSKAP